MKVLKKILKILGSIVLMVTVVFFGIVIKIMIDDSKPTSNNNSTSTDTTQYIDVSTYQEQTTYNEQKINQSVSLSSSSYQKLMNLLEEDQDFFTYAPYYEIDEILALYQETSINKKTTSTLLNQQGLLDAALLMGQVKKNNENYMNQGQDVINVFYTEMDATDMTMICDKIAEVVNTQSLVSIHKVANTLMQLTMFVKTGSASNAYITNDLTFVYNPTMTGLYANMQEIAGRDENTIESVIVHEIMHLLQYSQSDLDQTNGIEAGMCKMYNIPNESKRVVVDSLWYPWVLEASAELGMSDYLGVEPGTYQKKISYVNSYNLSRFHELDVGLEKVAFVSSLEDAFDTLNLTTQQQQQDFLKFMYSIEITQSDPKDFWESYMTSEDQTTIRMEIRTQAVNYLTKNFYTNLIKAIKDGTINDLSSVFYLMRLWELDVYNHLQYTTTSSLEFAENHLTYHSKLQEAVLNELAFGEMYEDYWLQTKAEDGVLDHCELNEEIIQFRSNYSSSRFSRIKDVYEYILQNE